MQRSLRKAIKGAKYVGPGVSIGLKQIQEARRAVREMVIPSTVIYIFHWQTNVSTFHVSGRGPVF